MEALRQRSGRRLILRYEIPSSAGYAVIISPAIDDGEILAPIAMPRRGLRCLPFQRRGSPGIAASLFSFEQAPDQIKYEHKLSEADDQGCHAHERIEVMGGCRDEGRFANVVIAAGHAQQAKIVHGEENRIGPKERDPEVESSKRLIEHSSG